MSRQLLVQRAVIVLVILAVLALAIAGILNSSTTPALKVIVIGVLTGFLAGGLIVAARGGTGDTDSDTTSRGGKK